MKTLNFGDMVVTTGIQNNERDIPDIKIGTKCVVIQVVNLPAYDLLVVPEGYNSPIIDENGIKQDYRTVYLLKNSWKLPPNKGRKERI